MSSSTPSPTRYWHELPTTAFGPESAARTIAVLPVGAIEQHGPHLPLNVDACINEGLVAASVAALPAELDVLVLPTQAIGYSEEHTDFAGTLSLEADTTARVWAEIGASVARAGVRKLVIFNSHGGQSQIARTVIRRLRIRHGMLAVATGWGDLCDLTDLIEAAELRHGIHGGAVETSLMLHLRPDLVAMDKAQNFVSLGAAMEKDYDLLTATSKLQFGWKAQDLHPSGAVGDATKATPELGAEIVARVTAGFHRLMDDVDRFDPAAFT